MSMGARSTLLVLIFLLAGCGEFRPIGPEYHYTRYKVQPSETLYSIAFRFGYDYREVAAWNNIPPPYTIRAGEELLILDPPAGADETPDEAAPSEPATAKTATPTVAHAPPSKWKPSASAPRTPKVATAKPPVKKPVHKGVIVAAAPTHTTGIVKWAWPTEGKIAARFAAKAGRKGIDVAGQSGQLIKAAADGEVVYSGNGLIGYGNLVIIKHDEAFLSAYGHNRKLLVKEGEKVKVGQAIGEMGQHPKSGSILHFEVRRNGKPVDPLLYLPNHTS